MSGEWSSTAVPSRGVTTPRRRRVASHAVVRDLALSYGQDLDAAQRGALTGWAAFTTTFVGVRVIAHSIKDKRGPFRNVTIGGVHLHHYMWGIGGLALVGALAVRGEPAAVRHPAIATRYGFSQALIVDEFALLLDLDDVYWQRQGRVSVDLAVTTIGTVALYFSAMPLAAKFRRRRREPVPAHADGRSDTT